MKLWKVILLNICAIIILAAIAIGIYWADRGSKEVGGYFDSNTVAAIASDEQYYYITILNEKFTLRRFLSAGSTTHS